MWVVPKHSAAPDAMNQPVVVVLDSLLNAPQPALEKACWLASKRGQPLVLYVNARDRALEAAVGADSERLARARDSVMTAWQHRLQTLLEELDAPASTTALFWESDDASALARLLRTEQPDMVVIHAQRTSGLRRLFFAPLHWQLIQQAPCAVLCVGDEAWSGEQPVAAAIDLDRDPGAENSINEAVVASARRLSTDFGEQLTLVNVVEYPDETLVMLAGDALPVTLGDADALKQFYQQRLHEFCQQHGLSPAQGALLEGPPGPALAEYTDQHGGILVMGATRHNALHRLFAGPTAQRMLQHTHGDVLVIKPPGFVSSWSDAPPLDAGQSLPE